MQSTAIVQSLWESLACAWHMRDFPAIDAARDNIRNIFVLAWLSSFSQQAQYKDTYRELILPEKHGHNQRGSVTFNSCLHSEQLSSALVAEFVCTEPRFPLRFPLSLYRSRTKLLV